MEFILIIIIILTTCYLIVKTHKSELTINEAVKIGLMVIVWLIILIVLLTTVIQQL